MIAIPPGLSLKLIVGIACALLLALLVHDRNRWKGKTEHYAALLSAERSAHSATVANYRAAAEQARNSDAANAARVKADQAAISERTSNDFESRIAAARARSERLRSGAGSAAADTRSGGAAPVPAVPTAAEGTAQGAGEDGLPQADQMIATEQAIQLDELIKWVERQAAVPRQ